jgi:hypothetical protein
MVDFFGGILYNVGVWRIINDIFVFAAALSGGYYIFANKIFPLAEKLQPQTGMEKI